MGLLLHSYDKNGILLAHRSDDTPDPFYYIMHAHDVCELYYFLDGCGYYTVEGANYPLSPGTLLLMREGEMHTLHIDPSKRYERITVNFAYEAVDPTNSWSGLRTLLYDRPLGRENFFNTQASCGYMRTLFDRLCHAAEQQSDHAVKALFSSILSEILYLKKSIPEASEPVEEEYDLKIHSLKKIEGKLVLDIIEYINENLFTIESLAEIERKFFFSRSYVNRVFRAATGSSVWNYVLFKRLIAAQAMLKSGVPASVAAKKCGFRDYSSFFKQYKNKLGMSPADERVQGFNVSVTDRRFPLK